MLWAARTDRRPVFHISARRSSNSVTAGPWHFTMNSSVLIRPLIHMDRPSAGQAILVSLWNSNSLLSHSPIFHSFRFLSIQKSGNDATDASTLSFRYIATEKNLARNFDTIFNLGYTRILSIEAIYRKQNLVSSSIAAIINIVAGR